MTTRARRPAMSGSDDAAELSLRDVADATGVSASTLSRIENGTGKPDADNIARLTSWLKMPMERILGARRAEGEDARASV